MAAVMMIRFQNFKEKIRLTKEFGSKGNIEIIDNKFIYIVLREKGRKQYGL